MNFETLTPLVQPCITAIQQKVISHLDDCYHDFDEVMSAYFFNLMHIIWQYPQWKDAYKDIAIDIKDIVQHEIDNSYIRFIDYPKFNNYQPIIRKEMIDKDLTLYIFGLMNKESNQEFWSLTEHYFAATSLWIHLMKEPIKHQKFDCLSVDTTQYYLLHSLYTYLSALPE